MSRNWSTAELADHYKRAGSPNPVTDACGERPHKYHAKPVFAEGFWFASQAEARHWAALKIAQERGLISDLERQVRYVLQDAFVDGGGRRIRAINYVADFRFKRSGRTVVADTKGMATPHFKDKEKMFRKRYPEIEFEVWKA